VQAVLAQLAQQPIGRLKKTKWAYLCPTRIAHSRFKIDLTRLSERDLVEAVACLASTDGDQLWLGVEENGAPTGLHF